MIKFVLFFILYLLLKLPTHLFSNLHELKQFEMKTSRNSSFFYQIPSKVNSNDAFFTKTNKQKSIKVVGSVNFHEKIGFVCFVDKNILFFCLDNNIYNIKIYIQ